MGEIALWTVFALLGVFVLWAMGAVVVGMVWEGWDEVRGRGRFDVFGNEVETRLGSVVRGLSAWLIVGLFIAAYVWLVLDGGPSEHLPYH